MAEYIEREKVYETLNTALNETDELKNLFSQDYIRGCRNTSSIVINDMKKIPAADVRPERHGKWVWDYEGYLRCSNCTQKAFFIPQYEDEPTQVETEYCPYCGAKMD